MHPNAERVKRALHERGSDCEVLELPSSARTAVEAAGAIGAAIGQIAKSLVFVVDGEMVLVIASGEDRVSLEKLARVLGGRPKRANADEVRAATGFPIGGVAPVGHERSLRTFVDQRLLSYAEIWASAGTPNAVFRTTPSELARITAAIVADLREGPGSR